MLVYNGWKHIMTYSVHDQKGKTYVKLHSEQSVLLVYTKTFGSLRVPVSHLQVKLANILKCVHNLKRPKWTANGPLIVHSCRRQSNTVLGSTCPAVITDPHKKSAHLTVGGFLWVPVTRDTALWPCLQPTCDPTPMGYKSSLSASTHPHGMDLRTFW